jgi:hypothetical protein
VTREQTVANYESGNGLCDPVEATKLHDNAIGVMTLEGRLQLTKR